MQLVLISSVLPDTTGAGQLLLHRHLAENKVGELFVFRVPSRATAPQLTIRRLIASLRKTPFHRVSDDLFALWNGRWLDSCIHSENTDNFATSIITVAHGDVFGAAQRYAVRARLPLISFFHDWWPDSAPIHKPFRRVIDKNFRRLYRSSALALCISPGMHEHLGRHANSHVLYPIPGARPISGSRPPLTGQPLHLLYGGNTAEYGPMLQQALDVFEQSDSVRLEIRGEFSHWPAAIRSKYLATNQLLPFAKGETLENWLESADAFLIPQLFSPEHARLMETNFPSKLTDYSSYSRPFVIWGPAAGSAARWAREKDAALIVDSPSPARLRDAAIKLAADHPLYMRYAQASAEAYRNEFNPETLQAQFVRLLHETVTNAANKS